MEAKNFPVALFNGMIVTTNGLYEIDDIDIETARKYVKQYGYISAIGHEATALLMSELLDIHVPMNRIQFRQEVGQMAIVFKLQERPSEGVILNREQIKKIGYKLKIMKRLK